MTPTRLLAVLAALLLSPIGDGAAAKAITSAPPAEVRARAGAPTAKAALVAPAATPLRIALAAPGAGERQRLQQKNQASRAAGDKATAKHRPLAIGFARDIPAGARIVVLSSLDWEDAADGGRVARVEVHSPDAAGLRLSLSMTAADPDLSIRFAGNAPDASVHGPYPANAIADAVAQHGDFVTPVLDGDTAIVELHAAAGAAVEKVSLVLRRASHLVVAGGALRGLSAKDARDIGSSGACNIDVACVSPSDALDRRSRSVGKMVFNDRAGFSYLCTGTLLNDSVSSETPYFFTAAHCIEGAYEAATLNVYWFFKALACGSVQTPPFALQTGGAMLLARSVDWDWTLLRLYGDPPAGTILAAWRAEPVPLLAVGTGLHHPQGDLMKFSQGSTPGYQVFSDGSSFIKMQWSQGTTEVGSSGSGLFTYLAGGDYYELRGGLFGGDASCSNRSGLDYYSRLDNMLPLVRQYLTPDASNPTGQAVVVEFYNRSLDHFFITSDANEINLLDTGVLRGWERTGLRFLAYQSPQPGMNPVCRFYLRPEVGDSHFYSGDPAECDRVRQQFGASWIYESPAVFYIALPHAATSACPAGMRPVWRFFNRFTTNHRYTPDVTLRDAMRADPAWIAEGYGPDAVIMCSPATND
ncbi:MAG: hypothetical protein KJ018_10510 [Burkholderiales bacterium]|nr:hypothetical protein [Burkholderiales bacterium]